MPDYRRTRSNDPSLYPQLVQYPDLSYTPLDQIGTPRGGIAIDHSSGYNTPEMSPGQWRPEDQSQVHLDQSSLAAGTAPEYVSRGDDSYRSPLETIPEGLSSVGRAVGNDLSSLGGMVSRGLDAITPSQGTIDNIAMRLQNAHAIGTGRAPLWMQMQEHQANMSQAQELMQMRRAQAAHQMQQLEETKRQNQWEDVFKVIGSNLSPPQQIEAFKTMGKQNPIAHQFSKIVNDKLLADFNLVKDKLGEPVESIMQKLTTGEMTLHDLSAKVSVIAKMDEEERHALVKEEAERKQIQSIADQYEKDPSSISLTQKLKLKEYYTKHGKLDEELQQLHLANKNTRLGIEGKEIELGAKRVMPQYSEEINLPNGNVQRDKYDPQTGQLSQITGNKPPASVTNVNMKQESAFEGELGKENVKDIKATQVKARDAASIISTIHQGRKLLDSGMITGVGAEYVTKFGQALQQIGFTKGKDAISNTQAFTATMANSVAKQIKEFGAGTGLSDADREYAVKMAGGDITLDEKSIRKILDMNETAARNIIKTHNKSVKGIKSMIPLNIEEPPEYKNPKQLSKEEFDLATQLKKQGMSKEQVLQEIQKRRGQ